MDILPSTSEITECAEEITFKPKFNDVPGRHRARRSGNTYIEDDINRLFESIEIRTPNRSWGRLNEGSKDAYRKSAQKRPIRAGSSQVLGIGISDQASLKQALRGLCISQASDMAAMKRLSKPVASPGVSEARTIQRLYRTVVIEANNSGNPSKEGTPSFLEISLVPERITIGSSGNETLETDLSNKNVHPSTRADAATQATTTGLPSQSLLPSDCGSKILTAEDMELKSGNHSSSRTTDKVLGG